jgi:hypothetical protein
VPLWVSIVLIALVPAVCEEMFFRGFMLNGLRPALGRFVAVLVAAIAFGLSHYSVARMPVTVGLGLLLGLLAVRYRSIWPPMLAHLLHNAFLISASSAGAQAWLKENGLMEGEHGAPPAPWMLAAAGLAALGVLIAALSPIVVRRMGDAGNRVALAPSMRS